MEHSCLVVLCTCGSVDEAERIARALVGERLAACVNILNSGVRSIYRWQGEVEETEEILLLIKTDEGTLPRVERRIADLHSYDTPEVVALPIASGSDKYLQWLREQLG